MENIKTLTIGEIVKENYSAAEVFEKFGIDFCCLGDRKFELACESSGADPDEVLKALGKMDDASGGAVRFDEWSLDFLADYIYNVHHKYIEQKTPLIKSYLEKICTVHGDRHPELHEIKEIFSESSGELAVHMKKEELTLFPYIRQMVQAKKKGSKAKSSVFSSVYSPIKALKDDHREEGEQLLKMATLSNHFKAPADACATYIAAYSMLKDYERDMHLHIHLENNILFSKAIKLEDELGI